MLAGPEAPARWACHGAVPTQQRSCCGSSGSSVAQDGLGQVGRCTAGLERSGGLSLVAGLAGGTGCLRARRWRVVWRLFERQREFLAGHGTGRDICCFLKHQRARLARARCLWGGRWRAA